MAVTLTGKISFLGDFNYGDQTGVQKKAGISNIAQLYNLASGVGLNQADKIYAETRTLAASGNTTLDLAGVMTDVFGAVITFARIKGIFIFADPANTNNVLMGAAAATQFIGPLGSATDVVNVRPGGFACFFAPDATGWAVGAGATDFLKFANSAAGTGVTYDLYLIGASA
jgi:hypothetical protein